MPPPAPEGPHTTLGEAVVMTSPADRGTTAGAETSGCCGPSRLRSCRNFDGIFFSLKLVTEHCRSLFYESPRVARCSVRGQGLKLGSHTGYPVSSSFYGNA
ncbi:hypothetical protein L798_09744 [Zootermopsis nevadensis]|uniref:Uncharacterized protein n=1 Tax=Zootermopsis nevadensis TaxID=136037 RepID=A0A067QYS0_ZOONE|nr:hypothetical protein L798_09744 [Zootermopsis nevadensis]